MRAILPLYILFCGGRGTVLLQLWEHNHSLIFVSRSLQRKGDRRCQPFWGEVGSLMNPRKDRGVCGEGQFCQIYSMFWCVCRVILFFSSFGKSVIEGDWEEQAKMGAFELPSILLALWESYLCLQQPHREAELWSKSRLDQSWLSSPSCGCWCWWWVEKEIQPHIEVLHQVTVLHFAPFAMCFHSFCQPHLTWCVVSAYVAENAWRSIFCLWYPQCTMRPMWPNPHICKSTFSKHILS